MDRSAGSALPSATGLNMPEACLSIAIECGHDVRKAINAAQSAGTAFFK